MSNKLLKALIVTMGLAILGFVYVTRTHAQPTAKAPSVLLVTTNWVGYLVIGEHDKIDRMTLGPQPAVMQQVQVGLRSDGLLVWRPAPLAH